MDTLPLHSTHERSQAVFGERNGREVVRHYGDVAGEYAAARQSVAVIDLSFRDALRITGEDRLSFLHGMCTNDIKGLPEWGTTYAAMVTVKGAMVADARVARRESPPEVVVDLEPGLYPHVREFLEKYLISEDAELHDGRDDVAVLGLVGPRSYELLQASSGTAVERVRRIPTVPGQAAPEGAVSRTVGFNPRTVEVGGERVVLLPSLLTSGEGVDLLVPRAKVQELWTLLMDRGAALSARAAGLDALEWVRVEDGVPRFGQDLLETTIPLEAELTHAISYNKGCYVGQEVIARATFRGSMNKKLVALSLGANDAAAGTELRRDGKKIGFVTSVVKSPRRGEFLALGYVHRAHTAPGTVVTLGETASTATVLAPSAADASVPAPA